MYSWVGEPLTSPDDSYLKFPCQAHDGLCRFAFVKRRQFKSNQRAKVGKYSYAMIRYSYAKLENTLTQLEVNLKDI